MIAYQVQLNGKPVATAGLSHGVISAIANWVFIPSDLATDSTKDWNASFSLAGLDNKTSEHLHWFRTNLRIGDEITLKLVEVDEVDIPTEPLFNKTKEEITKILNDEFTQTQKTERGGGGNSAALSATP